MKKNGEETGKTHLCALISSELSDFIRIIKLNLENRQTLIWSDLMWINSSLVATRVDVRPQFRIFWIDNYLWLLSILDLAYNLRQQQKRNLAEESESEADDGKRNVIILDKICLKVISNVILHIIFYVLDFQANPEIFSFFIDILSNIINIGNL